MPIAREMATGGGSGSLISSRSSMFSHQSQETENHPPPSTRPAGPGCGDPKNNNNNNNNYDNSRNHGNGNGINRNRNVGGAPDRRFGLNRNMSAESEQTFHDAFEENIPPNPSSNNHASYSVNDRHGGGGAGGGSHDSEEELEGMARFRARCGEIVDNEYSQVFILLLIALNSIMIGAATFPEVKDDPELTSVFEVVDLIVLVIFTIESMLQFSFVGPQRFFKDGWLVFDFVIVIVSWISVEFDHLRALRVLRALRFVTQVSILRNVVVALLSIVPSIAAIFTLLLLIFYIFAVMYTTLFKDMYALGQTSDNYFGRIDYSLFTLFQFLCLDEWSGIAYEVAAVYYWSWAIFIVFVVMSAFVVVNLLVAVICDALMILRTAEETMAKQSLDMDRDPTNDVVAAGGVEGTMHGHGRGGGLSMNGGNGGGSWRMLAPEDRIRLRVSEMERMIDEMVATQDDMAKTIQYLSLALYRERKKDGLGSIREAISADESVEVVKS